MSWVVRLGRTPLRDSTSNPSGRRSVAFRFAVLFLFFGWLASAAEIHGIVKNAEGSELLGKIEVSITGSRFHVKTDRDGKFQFSGVAPGNYTLRISGVGYRGVSQPFSVGSSNDAKDFEIFLVPDFFHRSEVVEVHGDIFRPADWPAVGDFNLTSSEIQQTSTVAINDPYRSLESLPGVSASANDDLLAQFSVMGAPYENVGVYVDDVLVPNLLHTIPGIYQAPSVSLFTGNDVDELRLLPVAYPMRYADGAGAALEITSRTGTEGAPLFHFSAGLVEVEGLAEGGFSPSHHGTWLISARKSYTGYLDQFLDSNSYSDVGLYDANLKLTYDLTAGHTLSFFATGGQTHVSDPSIPATDPFYTFKSGSNDLAIGRLGWRWQILRNLVLDSRAAYVRTRYEEDNPMGGILLTQLDREWSGGTILSWSYAEGGFLQAGYSYRRPLVNEQSASVDLSGVPTSVYSETPFHTQDVFAQVSQQIWKGKLQLTGGFRWAKQNTVRLEPFSGQVSASIRLLANTELEFGWGKYDQFTTFDLPTACQGVSPQLFCFLPLPYTSIQYLVAVEHRLGPRIRLRVEGFSRENDQRDDLYSFNPKALIANSLPFSSDYSRGIQILLQRRSENRLSGWVGYTLAYARQKLDARNFPQLPPLYFPGTPYGPTLSDQRHNVNLFASYRLTPTIRLGVKNLFGTGFPLIPGQSPNFRLGNYERLDLRLDKSWQFANWKLGLYAELLNATNHYNPVFSNFGSDANGNQIILTSQGVPITPTVGIAFDF